jgi:hypothetical protein
MILLLMNSKLLNHLEYAYELVNGEEADYLIIDFINVFFLWTRVVLQ